MRLKDKVCIITGGANGIGESTAYKFGQEGAVVIICDIDLKAVENVTKEMKSRGFNAHGYKLDVTSEDDIKQFVAKIVKDFERIDVLINNAGILIDAQLYKMETAKFDKVIDVNLRGTFLCAKYVVAVMREQKSGSIVNASSIVGMYGNFGQSNYAASKFGVIGLAKTWAKELGHLGIRANAVCPGFIKTSIIENMPKKVIDEMESRVALKRLGEPDEIANVYLFLASDESSYVTGTTIDISGYTTI